ncbi:hypothetical protein [Macrococcus sp. DPC7161]|uniref:hypothetical protein n=1 Tax=Macrococcus sp. DPC7161 TaxID=2507060 RepID=UPI00100ADC52|nr:hypothetical protein [Macrococcus sp. DPC7161]RXK18326.1 hypothetical protein ER639_06445 [Macrococcus sp. DPC7161]
MDTSKKLLYSTGIFLVIFISIFIWQKQFDMNRYTVSNIEQKSYKTEESLIADIKRINQYQFLNDVSIFGIDEESTMPIVVSYNKKRSSDKEYIAMGYVYDENNRFRVKFVSQDVPFDTGSKGKMQTDKINGKTITYYIGLKENKPFQTEPSVSDITTNRIIQFKVNK